MAPFVDAMREQAADGVSGTNEVNPATTEELTPASGDGSEPLEAESEPLAAETEDTDTAEAATETPEQAVDSGPSPDGADETADSEVLPAPESAEEADAASTTDPSTELPSLPADLPSDPVEFLELYEQLQLQLVNLAEPVLLIADTEEVMQEGSEAATPEPEEDLSSLTDEDRAIALAQRAVNRLAAKQHDPTLTEQEAIETTSELDDATTLLAELEQAQQQRLEDEAVAEAERVENERQASEAAKAQVARRRVLLREWEAASEECDDHEVHHATLQANIVEVLRQRQNKEPVQQTSMAEALQQFNLAMTRLKDLEATERQFDVDTKALVRKCLRGCKHCSLACILASTTGGRRRCTPTGGIPA